MANPVSQRRLDYNLWRDEIGILERGLCDTRNLLNDYLNGAQAYAHIDPKEMEQVQKAVDEKYNWMSAEKKNFESVKLCQISPIFASQVKAQKDAFAKVVMPILEKPKPVVEHPEETKEEPKESINC